jgi:hypothetical protein
VSRRQRPVAAPFAQVDAAVAAVVAEAGHLLPGGGNHWRHVADVLGRLVAQGRDDFAAALATLKEAAAKRYPEMAADGRDMRMAHALHDAVQRWELTRGRAKFAIRRALAPMLAERAASARLLAAARAVNAEAGAPLTDLDVLGEVRREVFWAARRQRGAGGRAV